MTVSAKSSNIHTIFIVPRRITGHALHHDSQSQCLHEWCTPSPRRMVHIKPVLHYHQDIRHGKRQQYLSSRRNLKLQILNQNSIQTWEACTSYSQPGTFIGHTHTQFNHTTHSSERPKHTAPPVNTASRQDISNKQRTSLVTPRPHKPTNKHFRDNITQLWPSQKKPLSKITNHTTKVDPRHKAQALVGSSGLRASRKSQG